MKTRHTKTARMLDHIAKASELPDLSAAIVSLHIYYNIDDDAGANAFFFNRSDRAAAWARNWGKIAQEARRVILLEYLAFELQHRM